MPRAPVTCSWCQYVGHNRRNKNCRLLVGARTLCRKLSELHFNLRLGFVAVTRYIHYALTFMHEMCNLIAAATLDGCPCSVLESNLSHHVDSFNEAILDSQIGSRSLMTGSILDIRLVYGVGPGSLIEYPILNLRKARRDMNTNEILVGSASVTSFNEISATSTLYTVFANEMMLIFEVYSSQGLGQGLVEIKKLTKEYIREMSITYAPLEEEVDDIDCSICYDIVKACDAVVTNCCHKYCVTCIKSQTTVIKDKTIVPTCPCCRTNITELKSGNQEILEEMNSHIQLL